MLVNALTGKYQIERIIANINYPPIMRNLYTKPQTIYSKKNKKIKKSEGILIPLLKRNYAMRVASSKGENQQEFVYDSIMLGKSHETIESIRIISDELVKLSEDISK